MSTTDRNQDRTDENVRGLLTATDMVENPAGDIDAELGAVLSFNRTGCANQTMYSGSPMCCC